MEYDVSKLSDASKSVFEQIRQRLYDNPPPVPYMQQGAIDYVLIGLPPGGFLTALFANDLMGAFGKADESNTAAMKQWVVWLYNICPRDAIPRSEAGVVEWVRLGGLAGMLLQEQEAETVDA